MYLTIHSASGQRLVLEVTRLCYLGEPADMDMSFMDFVKGAEIRNSTEEEMLYFAPEGVSQ